jgi:hypothetical protein
MSLDIHALREREQVKQAIDVIIARMKLDEELFTHIMNALKRFEGKTITRRIETAIKALPALQGFYVSYDSQHTMFQIKIWSEKKGITYENMFSILLSYRDNPIVNTTWILENNKRYGNVAQRIKRLEAFKELAGDFCNRWNHSVQQLNAIEAELDEYKVKYIF